MSHVNKMKSDGNGKTAQGQKRKGAKKFCIACSTNEAAEKLPLINTSENRTPAITTRTGRRKRSQPPAFTAIHTGFMAPWEGSSHSSFTSIPPVPPFHSPPSPLPHPPIPLSKTFPTPPETIKGTNPDGRQSNCTKRRLPFRGPSRPSRLPPLRQVSNLSFSRSFTFSFFELPWHQSVQNRANRFKELVVLLRKMHY